MAELMTLARPYAKAAFEFALNDNSLSSWSDMLAVLSAVSETETVKALLASPTYTDEQKADCIIELCSERLNDNGKNFVRVLSDNKRLDLLTEVYGAFDEMKAAQERTVDVDIVTAFELTDAVYAKLTQTLESRLSRQLKVKSSVDNNLIGGVVIRAGDLVIDGSIRGKLAKLSESLIS